MALVRVRKDGFEFNVGENYAAAKGLEVIDSPTHAGGRPRGATRVNDRPTKPRRSVDELAAEKGTKSPAEKSTGKAASSANGTDNPPPKEK